MRTFFIVFAFVLVTLLSVLGFRQTLMEKPPLEIFPDMKRQSKYKPQGESEFFADGRSSRPVVPGTVARAASGEGGDRLEDDHLMTGRVNGEWAEAFPGAVTQEMMERGRARYRIYCTSCHGGVGDGDGITSAYGMQATTFHVDPIREMPNGQLFNIITEGSRLMGAYGDKITPEDRWAVIAYVRALQRSRQGTVEDVPEEIRTELGL
ncbi:MAG: cytochrome c [Opitutales bacterium]